MKRWGPGPPGDRICGRRLFPSGRWLCLGFRAPFFRGGGGGCRGLPGRRGGAPTLLSCPQKVRICVPPEAHILHLFLRLFTPIQEQYLGARPPWAAWGPQHLYSDQRPTIPGWAAGKEGFGSGLGVLVLVGEEKVNVTVRAERRQDHVPPSEA